MAAHRGARFAGFGFPPEKKIARGSRFDDAGSRHPLFWMSAGIDDRPTRAVMPATAALASAYRMITFHSVHPVDPSKESIR
jgi:hypothetical protein